MKTDQTYREWVPVNKITPEINEFKNDTNIPGFPITQFGNDNQWKEKSDRVAQVFKRNRRFPPGSLIIARVF